MANTYRESTADHGGVSIAESVGSVQLPTLGCDPNLSTSVTANCQQDNRMALPICSAMLSCIAGAVDTAHIQHNRTNGSTVSLLHGSMTGKRLFAVSIYPERMKEFWDRPSWQELFEFANAHLDLLLKPFHAVGSWYNDYECIHSIDVVICLPDRDAALDAGLRAGQWAIFDLEARREIAIPRPGRVSSANLSGGGNA